MDWIWIISGGLLLAGGVLGCVLPVIPGPPLGFFGLLLLQLTSFRPFEARQLFLWAGLAALVTFLDYVVPVWGTRKFGGSKLGAWGSMAGLLLGLLVPPWGIIAGPFLGAVTGELLDGKAWQAALRAGFGSFIGFLAGTVMKLAVSVYFCYLFIAALV
ncbi:MAG TPA: DUF456 domain-containing protein [Bacteroidales bacterium]|nr:DUF456 domain-containing protein [Bacteroidales bacterium]